MYGGGGKNSPEYHNHPLKLKVSAPKNTLRSIFYQIITDIFIEGEKQAIFNRLLPKGRQKNGHLSENLQLLF